MNIKTKRKLTESLIKLLSGALKKQWTKPSTTNKSDLLSNIESGNVDINDAATFIRKRYVLENLNEYFWIVEAFINNFLVNRLSGPSNNEIKGSNKEVTKLVKEFIDEENKNVTHKILSLFQPIINFAESVFKSFTIMYNSGDIIQHIEKQQHIT